MSVVIIITKTLDTDEYNISKERGVQAAQLRLLTCLDVRAPATQRDR